MSAAVMSPVTLVKTRMEYGGPNHIAYKNTADALATIARTEGPSGLFRGLMPTVLTNAPFSALYFMIYTQLKAALGTWQGQSSSSGGGSTGSGWNSTAINFVSGVCAATAATLLTQPTDVVRTRMQLGLPGTARGDALSTLGHVLRSRGPNALLTGRCWTARPDALLLQGEGCWRLGRLPHFGRLVDSCETCSAPTVVFLLLLLLLMSAGAAPRVLKRTLQTALVWTLYEELLPRLSAVYHLAVAQQEAAQETQAGSSTSSSAGSSSRKH